MADLKAQQRVEREEESRAVGFFAAMRAAHEQQAQPRAHENVGAPLDAHAARMANMHPGDALSDDPDVVVIDDAPAGADPQLHAPPRVAAPPTAEARAKRPRALVCWLFVLVPMTLALFVSSIASTRAQNVAGCYTTHMHVGPDGTSQTSEVHTDQYHTVNGFTITVGIVGSMALAVVAYCVAALARHPGQLRAAKVVCRTLPVVLVALLISQIALAADFGRARGLVGASPCHKHHQHPAAWGWLEASHVIVFFAALFLLRRVRMYLAAHAVVLPRWNTCPARGGCARGGGHGPRESWTGVAKRWTRGALVTADSFVGTARSWMSVTLRVKEADAPYWSEVQLAGDRTLVSLGVSVANALGIDARDIELLLKNGDTQVMTDADVARLRAGDTIIVERTTRATE